MERSGTESAAIPIPHRSTAVIGIPDRAGGDWENSQRGLVLKILHSVQDDKGGGESVGDVEISQGRQVLKILHSVQDDKGGGEPVGDVEISQGGTGVEDPSLRSG